MRRFCVFIKYMKIWFCKELKKSTGGDQSQQTSLNYCVVAKEFMQQPKLWADPK